MINSSIEKILGMNARNLDCIYPNNNRKDYPMVDDKKLTKEILNRHNFPCVPLLGHAVCQFDLPKLMKSLDDIENFVIKPAHGFGGGGIKVFSKREGEGWFTISGKWMAKEEVLEHCEEILFGVYSIDNSPDQVLIEPRLENPLLLKEIAYQGLPDIRMIAVKGQAIQAMLRLPTKQSDGRANLHVGGIGVGIDIETGTTNHAIQKGNFLTHHPDTGAMLSGIKIPHWSKLKSMSCEIQKVIPLGYLGLDWVLDQDENLFLLELNARPGIEIQNANKQGLRELLEGVL